jgi:hypothetical protein
LVYLKDPFIVHLLQHPDIVAFITARIAIILSFINLIAFLEEKNLKLLADLDRY